MNRDSIQPLDQEDSEDDVSFPNRIKSPTEVTSDEEEPFDYRDSSDDDDSPKTEERFSVSDPKDEEREVTNDGADALNSESCMTMDQMDRIEKVSKFVKSSSSKEAKHMAYLLAWLFGPEHLEDLEGFLSKARGTIKQLIRIDKQIVELKSKKVVLDGKVLSDLVESRKKLCSLVNDLCQ